jgi:hypothetical protein
MDICSLWSSSAGVWAFALGIAPTTIDSFSEGFQAFFCPVWSFNDKYIIAKKI